MNRRFAAAVIALGLLVARAVPAWAHHSLQSEFDIDKSVTLKGVITKVDRVNPHVFVYVDVKDASGRVTTWSLASLPTAVLRRNGVTKQLLRTRR